MRHSPTSEAKSRSAKGPLQCSQKPTSGVYPEPKWCSPHNPTLLPSDPSKNLLSSHLYLVFQVVSSFQIFRPKFCKHFSSLMCWTCPAHLILLDFITIIIIIISGKYELCSSSLGLRNFLQTPLAFSSVQVYSSAPSSHTNSIYVLLLDPVCQMLIKLVVEATSYCINSLGVV
jgi:hypothetical protein